jgi:hypothetical protein
VARDGKRYWPALVTVWHHEPGGADAGEVCRHYRVEDGRTVMLNAWKWHVHHWRLQVHPLQDLRRTVLTRCEWCGGRQRKRDGVNHSLQWDRADSPWWRGERGLYHSDCATVRTAHQTCLCDVPLVASNGATTCASCGQFMRYGGWPERVRLLYRELREIPEGTRDRARYLAAVEAPL